MDLKLTHSFLIVDDQDKALGFYRDALSLTVTNDVQMEGFRWLTLSGPSQPGVEIVLAAPDMGHGPEDAQALRTLVAKGALSGVIFGADDVDVVFEQVRASGAEVLQEPIDQPYGVRDCAFRDPSGNHIRIASPLALPS
ncbi:MAG TPA: VOC family protein [Streptosporangiaceae bacterium]|nr:VOC family protein [Streptosporangiaceae bacterium]